MDLGKRITAAALGVSGGGSTKFDAPLRAYTPHPAPGIRAGWRAGDFAKNCFSKYFVVCASRAADLAPGGSACSGPKVFPLWRRLLLWARLTEKLFFAIVARPCFSSARKRPGRAFCVWVLAGVGRARAAAALPCVSSPPVVRVRGSLSSSARPLFPVPAHPRRAVSLSVWPPAGCALAGQEPGYPLGYPGPCPQFCASRKKCRQGSGSILPSAKSPPSRP